MAQVDRKLGEIMMQHGFKLALGAVGTAAYLLYHGVLLYVEHKDVVAKVDKLEVEVDSLQTFKMQSEVWKAFHP